jgi:cardiolipin synthase
LLLSAEKPLSRNHVLIVAGYGVGVRGSVRSITLDYRAASQTTTHAWRVCVICLFYSTTKDFVMNNRSRLSAMVRNTASTALLCLGMFGTIAGAHAATATTTQTLITEPDQGLTPIYNLIQSATTSIDMTMYELVDTQAQSLLCTAAQNGIKVRVILDQNDEYSNNLAAYNQLQGCGASVVWAWTKYEATHQKTIVIDGATAAVMTLNLTSRYYSSTRDFAVIDVDANDIAAIESTFNADFIAQTITPPVGDDLVWSPTNAKTQLLSVINSAQTSLLVENEEMSYSTIVSALESAAKRGVNVTICMTGNGAAIYPCQGNRGRLRHIDRTRICRLGELFFRLDQ